MSEEIILTVLNEVLEELKEANKSLKEIDGKIVGLGLRVQAFEEKEIKVESPDLEPVRSMILDGAEDIRKEMTVGMVKIAMAVEGRFKGVAEWFFGTIIVVFIIGVVYLLVSQYITRTASSTVPVSLSVDTAKVRPMPILSGAPKPPSRVSRKDKTRREQDEKAAAGWSEK